MATGPARRRRRRQFRDVESTISDLARLRFTPPEIHERLLAELGAADAPSLRTVQRIVRDLSIPDYPDESWTLADSSDDEARAALEAFVELGPYSGSMHGSMAKERTGRAALLERRWVFWLARLKNVVPGIPFNVASSFASQYTYREDRNEDTEDLDYALAWAPTRPETTAEFLVRVVNHAKVHREVWPDRVFRATSFQPVSALVAGQVHAALTVLTPPNVRGLITWIPSIELSDELQEAIDEARKGIAQRQEQWESLKAQMNSLERRTITPENKWWALDHYLSDFLEQQLGQD